MPASKFRELSELSAEERNRVKAISDRFASSWNGSQPSVNAGILSSCLSASDDLIRSTALVELVKIDLERRWAAGDEVLLESYASEFEFGRESIPASLLLFEFQLRTKHNRQVSLAEYASRFPTKFEEFKRRLPSVDQTLDIADSTLSNDESQAKGTLKAPRASGYVPRARDSRESPRKTKPPQEFIIAASGYRLLKFLGEGKMGEVWLAEAPGGIEVAVKVILFPVGHRMTDMELRALDTIKCLRHSYLLQVQAYWESDERLFIVLELADETLDDERLRAETGQPVPVEKLVRYMREAGEAIDYLHAEKVLHRDIKPANILLVNGHVKVADFGLARVLPEQQVIETKTPMGTPLYMAPEVWKGKASARSDQYSLAATYAELRTGKPIFASQNLVEVMNDHLSRSPDLALLPVAEQAVLRKALAKSAEDRYTSCSAFADALATATATEKPIARGKWRSLSWSVPILLAMIGGGWLWNIWRTPLILPTFPRTVSVRAGEIERFEYSVNRAFQSLDLEFFDVPQGVSLEKQSTPTGAEIFVTANLTARPGDHKLRINSKIDNQDRSSPLALVVAPPDIVSIPKCISAEKELYQDEGRRIFHERLNWISPKGQQVELILIWRNIRHPDDPATFYIMRYKVTNELFTEFAEDRKPLHSDGQWQKGALAAGKYLSSHEHPKLPVFNVHVEDAAKFASWMGGRLPSARQWDKAAGRFDATPDILGPFVGSLADVTPETVAVDRIQEGPLPVGQATADISKFGCHDMSGNGLEWTRDIHNNPGQTVPIANPSNKTFVILRGRSYIESSAPLLYKDLEDEQHVAEPYVNDELKPDISFRVVLEVP